MPYLIGLADSVPTAAYAENYARIVAEKAVLRDLIGASGQVMQTAYDQAMPLEQILDKAESSIFELSSNKRNHNFQDMGGLVVETFDHINELLNNPDPVSGIRTGFKELDNLTAGLQPSSLYVLAARPAMGKCLTAHTLIDVPGTGERVTIQDFVKREGGCVYGVSDTGQVRPTNVSAWIDSGVKPVFRVTTRSGRFVEVTGHHPFLTHKGWTPLHDIAVGEKIAVPRVLPTFGADKDLPLGKVRLLAYLIAEGNLTNPSARFTNTDPILVTDLKSIIAEHYPELSVTGTGIDYRIARTYLPGARKNQSNPLTLWLRDLGLMGKHAEHKRFPESVWRWDRERLAMFLRVLFSCDGTIYALGAGKRARIEFTVASEGLAQDVQHALVRFGIVAKLWQKTPRSWRVEITEARSVDVYQKTIGWFGEKKRRRFNVNPELSSNVGQVSKQIWPRIKELAAQRGLSLSELAKRAGEKTEDGYNAHTSRGITQKRLQAYAEILDDDKLRCLANPELYWDEIVSIEALGAQQVYDLTVPDGSNFIAQDICVHNTAFALTIGLNVALKAKETVGIFNLEMSAVQLVTRMLCSEARVDMSRVRNGQLSERDFQRLADTAGKLSEAKIYIDDNANMSVMELRSRCRRLMAEQNLGLVIIDYLQLMSGAGGKMGENRQHEISTISRGLKLLARELDIPVIVLSQLSRAVESRPNKRPMLSDLRESGAIEQDADMVMFIYRDEYYDQQSEKQGIAEIIIGKQRNGPVGTVELQFHNAHVRFNDLAKSAP